MEPASIHDITTGDMHVPDDDEGRQRFSITSPGAAEWALRKLQAIGARQAENRAMVDEEIRRLNDWLQNHPQNAALARDRRFFEALLEQWWRDQLAKALADAGGDWSKVRDKSRSFPAGTIGATYHQPVPEYDDAAAVVAWLEDHAFTDAVAVEKAPVKPEVKNLIKRGELAVADGAVVDPATGEVVPGISVPQVVDPLDAVTVKVSPA